MVSLFRRWRGVLLALLIGVLSLGWGMPALADAGAALGSPAFADLEAALTATSDPQRRADLEALQEAVAASDDRAQITNSTTHSLGVFTRYKKDPAGTPPSFNVLAPGHETDDDYDVVALLVPPRVALRWGEAGRIEGAETARVTPLLPGEQLQLSDPAEVAAAGSSAYQLSLPPLQVATSLDDLAAALPALSQGELDLAPETAPLD